MGNRLSQQAVCPALTAFQDGLTSGTLLILETWPLPGPADTLSQQLACGLLTQSLCSAPASSRRSRSALTPTPLTRTRPPAPALPPAFRPVRASRGRP